MFSFDVTVLVQDTRSFSVETKFTLLVDRFFIYFAIRRTNKENEKEKNRNQMIEFLQFKQKK